jgi:hypothetical protein
VKISQTAIFNEKCEKGDKLGMGFAVHKSIIHSQKFQRHQSKNIDYNYENEWFGYGDN